MSCIWKRARWHRISVAIRIVASTIAVSDFSRDVLGGVGRRGVVHVRRALVIWVVSSVRTADVARRCVRRRVSVEARQEFKDADEAAHVRVTQIYI